MVWIYNVWIHTIVSVIYLKFSCGVAFATLETYSNCHQLAYRQSMEVNYVRNHDMGSTTLRLAPNQLISSKSDYLGKGTSFDFITSTRAIRACNTFFQEILSIWNIKIGLTGVDLGRQVLLRLAYPGWQVLQRLRPLAGYTGNNRLFGYHLDWMNRSESLIPSWLFHGGLCGTRYPTGNDPIGLPTDPSASGHRPNMKKKSSRRRQLQQHRRLWLEQESLQSLWWR